jgi:hypothetical protein
MEAFGSRMTQFAGLYATSLVTGHYPAYVLPDTPNAFELFNAGRELPMDIPIAFPAFNNVFTCIDPHSIKYDTFVLKNVIRDDAVFSLDPNRNYSINGLFHTYNYWIDFECDILSLFEFNPQLVEHATTLLPKTTKKIVGISYRYEYKKLNTSHVQLDKWYYETAMNMFADCIFLIFSDDIKEAKRFFGEKENILYTKDMSSAVGICTLSLCDHIINANSSFSLWASFLNKNKTKQIICPTYWVRTPEFSFINGNYYPETWINI